MTNRSMNKNFRLTRINVLPPRKIRRNIGFYNLSAPGAYKCASGLFVFLGVHNTNTT